MTGVDLQHGKRLVVTGLASIVLGMALLSAILLGSGGRNAGIVVARLVVVLLTSVMVYRGHQWARWLLGFFAVGGALAGLVGVANAGGSTAGIALFLPLVLLFLVGVGIAFVPTDARGFLQAQRAGVHTDAIPPAI